MSVNLKDKTVLVYDRGLWPSLAERLAREDGFGRVLYYSEWKDAAPRLNKYLVGTGLNNVSRVRSFWRSVPKADVVVFADVNDGDIQETVRDVFNKPVWGCLGADELEIHRWEAREAFKQLGLEVPKGVLITGLSNLRAYLKENEDKWIKFSVFRGDVETFHHETYRLTETTLDEWQRNWGPASEIVEFIVDDPIEDAVEFGYDGGFCNGQFWPVAMWGYEVKDNGYVGKVCANEDLPDDILYVNNVLAPILSGYGYCGFFSTEIRRRRDGAPILMELTCRAPSPPGEAAMELWENLPEMIYTAAVNGYMDQPVPLGTHAAEVMIYSDWSDSHWTALDIPDSERQWFKLSFSARIANYPQIVPQNIGWGKVGGVVAIGDAIDQTCKRCSARVPLIKGKGIEADANTLDEAESVIEQGRKFGIPF